MQNHSRNLPKNMFGEKAGRKHSVEIFGNRGNHLEGLRRHAGNLPQGLFSLVGNLYPVHCTFSSAPAQNSTLGEALRRLGAGGLLLGRWLQSTADQALCLEGRAPGSLERPSAEPRLHGARCTRTRVIVWSFSPRSKHLEFFIKTMFYACIVNPWK